MKTFDILILVIVVAGVALYLRPAKVCKFLRIYSNSAGDPVSLTEVQAKSAGENGVNVAPMGIAVQTSTAYNGYASRAIDGNYNGDFNDGSVTHTNHGVGEYWQLSLIPPVELAYVTITNRNDHSIERLNGCTLILYDNNSTAYYKATLSDATIQTVYIE